MSLPFKNKSEAVARESQRLSNGGDSTTVWTTGQEFQFYVPWLWIENPSSPQDDACPSRQVVRIPRPMDAAGSTVESREAWIQDHVTRAVRDLVHDQEHYPTRTERELVGEDYDQKTACRNFDIVQSRCSLPLVTVPDGYDGVLPVEMTKVTKRIFVHRDQASNSARLEWLNPPSAGSCIERIKNQVRIHLTSECSLHIHVRPQIIRDFDLVAFKKMASLVWLAESRLDKLYHPVRNSSDSPLQRSLRSASNLALDKSPYITGSLDDYDIILGPVDLVGAEKDKLVTLWRASGRYQLRELLRVHPDVGKHEFPAYNFFNWFMVSEKQTIEFRKMESTTDARVIDAWVEVFVLLADFCMTCSVKEFQRIMENLGKPDSAYGTWNFLGDIGCKSQTVEVLRLKFIQQWGPEEPAPGGGADTTSSNSASTGTGASASAFKPRLRDAIRDGTKKLGGKIAEGYSYGG